MAYQNGRLPKSALAPIRDPQGVRYLRKDAAAAWNTMSMFIQRTTRVQIGVTGPRSAYRTYSEQVQMKKEYGSNAANPGESNHGWGLSADLRSRIYRAIIDRVGAYFGWAKKWSDASWEWWHLKWREGVWDRPDPGLDIRYPIAKLGSGGRGQAWFVKKLQKRLRVHGHKVEKTGTFNKQTLRAVKAFQRSKKMKVDGIVGKKTWIAIGKPAPKPKPVKKPTPKPKPKPPTKKPGAKPKPAPKPKPKPKPQAPTKKPKPKTPAKKPGAKISPKKASLSQAGALMIGSFEGFRAAPYNDPVGHATIGYGHLLHYGPVTAADRKKWGTITRSEGLELLKKDAQVAINAIRTRVKVPLTQNQIDALASFIYNVGAGAFADSTLLRKLNAGDYRGASNEFGRWVRGGSGVLPGLVRRREAEASLFRRKS